MEYINKVGAIVTKIGTQRTEFPGGKPVTITQPWDKKVVPAVNISVKFDFDPDKWYSANITQADINKYIAEGKSVDIKTWVKESNGTTYYNFAIMYPKKQDASEVVANELNPLKTTVHRHTQQIVSLHTRLKALEGDKVKKETTTAFDDDFADVFPDEYAALNAGHNDDTPPLDSYNESDWQGDVM